MKTHTIIILLCLSLLIVACTNETTQSTPELNNTNTQIANPASTNCINNGGTLEIKDSPQGQYGVCIFNDKSECEEWAFFRGECQKGNSNKIT